MSKKDKLLRELFDPNKTKKIKFTSIISLLESLGAEVDQSRKGSNVFVSLKPKDRAGDPRMYNFHKPHPEKEAKAYVVRALREFLEVLGYWPTNDS